MEQISPSDEDIRRMLYEAVGKWRSNQLASGRDMISNVQDKLDNFENSLSESNPNKEAMKLRLEEHAARLADQKNDRIAMIEDTYKLMIDFVDRRERDAQ